MIVKVCGMKNPEQVKMLDPIVDYIGFIFYYGSKRYVKTTPSSTLAKRVGVFVNANQSYILEMIEEHQLDIIQLHGDEPAFFCQELKEKTSVIKAFGIDESFNFSKLSAYEKVVDYFLFDTNTSQYGGSGRKFNWELLNQYSLDVPFLLSGGISPDSIKSIKEINHPQFTGIDLNSGFENQPADKNISILKPFIDAIKQ
ncbi:MAG: phosphoribosylanthranilate isomerase [Crocinitomicaceae bacterium]|nr:phosphoribosylanthranilate isomerase [Crocinitomicaceae bacterium]